MSSIFANPNDNKSNYFGQKVLFLHGLEGSPNGQKAKYLKEKWGALCPPMRTDLIRELNIKKGQRNWSNIDSQEIESALEPVMEDALDAINYLKPDIVVGSSMGGAILMKLIFNQAIDINVCSPIFLAPAIKELVRPLEEIPTMKNSVWVLGEVDRIVENSSNIKLCKSCNGNLVFSPNDNHRLSIALNSGLIDAAILTGIEVKAANLIN